MSKSIKFLLWMCRVISVLIMLYGVYTRIAYRNDQTYWFFAELDTWQLVFGLPVVCLLLLHLAQKVLEGKIDAFTPKMPKGTIHKSLDELRQQLYEREQEDEE